METRAITLRSGKSVTLKRRQVLEQLEYEAMTAKLERMKPESPGFVQLHKEQALRGITIQIAEPLVTLQNVNDLFDVDELQEIGREIQKWNLEKQEELGPLSADAGGSSLSTQSLPNTAGVLVKSSEA